MKIMELCLSNGVGGLELYVARTAIALRERGIDCLCVCAKDSLLHHRLRENDLPLRTLAVVTRKLPLLAAWRLAKLIDQAQVDILHFHWGKDFLLVVLAKLLASRPFQLIYTRQMMITRAKKDRFHRFLYRHLDRYLTITDELKGLAQQYLPMPASRIQRLYYGVAAAPIFTEVDRMARRESLFPGLGDSFLVGLVGRIERQKGQYLLIQAVADLRQSGADIKAVIIGPAMSDAYLKQLHAEVKQRGLESAIHFYGSHPNPLDIMPALDVLVLATRQETFGLVLIEAMRAGVAVIGTRAGGVPEIIDHDQTGLLFSPDSAVDLAMQLKRLLNNPELRGKLALAGKAKADKLFSREAHYDALVKIFAAS